MTDGAVAELARKIAKPGTVVTWLNHWSIQKANWRALAQLTTIGVDGTLLQMVLNRNGYSLSRTSADLVLPVLFNEVLAPRSRIVFLGAAPGVAKQAANRITQHRTLALDGYDELAAIRRNPSRLKAFDPEVIVLGLGAPLQEEVAIEMHQVFPHAIICTAGGWIDQLAKDEQYFPEWVHQYRLGWAWRIAHEPRRLTRRYTIDALAFLLQRRVYIAKLAGLRATATASCLEL